MTNAALQKLYTNVERFEEALCVYTGSRYAIAVDCCTNALLLCLQYTASKKIILPKNTFIGVAAIAKHLNIEIAYQDISWNGIYKISPTNIFDSARRFTSNMFIPKSFMCLSFHYKKHLKIGRGGAILMDNKKAYDWFKLARNCGKNTKQPLPEQTYSVCGWNMLLHPELAKKGNMLLKKISKHNPDLPHEHYGNLELQVKF